MEIISLKIISGKGNFAHFSFPDIFQIANKTFHPVFHVVFDRLHFYTETTCYQIHTELIHFKRNEGL